MLIIHIIIAVLKFDVIPWWGALLTSTALGLLVALLVKFVVNPRLRRKILGQFSCDYLKCTWILRVCSIVAEAANEDEDGSRSDGKHDEKSTPVEMKTEKVRHDSDMKHENSQTSLYACNILPFIYLHYRIIILGRDDKK